MAAGDGKDRRDQELELFHDAMRGVRRLGLEPRHTPARPLPRPRARFARADRQAVLAESLADLRQPLAPVIENGEELIYRRDGVPEQVLRKLRSGHYRVEGELDLHGLNLPQAEAELAACLAAALARELRVLRIVHGKGLRSGNRGPVLKQLVNSYLRRVDAVLAFASAREVDGGAGAALVLLANRRTRQPR
jgi:DNA-nicking Smr family endonuclease